jgi:CDP-4-dehydro-6-deoxyglucose reductase
LPDLLEEEICLIATGTGIAPYRSMLLDLVNHSRSSKNIYLISETRYIKDILYRKEMEELQHKIPTLSFIPVLSRETDPGYEGRRDMFTRYMKNYLPIKDLLYFISVGGGTW